MTDWWTPRHLEFTGHALRQLFARSIGTEAVRMVIATGEIVAEYPDDRPFPSRLLLGFFGNRPIHVVLAYNKAQDIGYVVTAYEPDATRWLPDFKQRS